LIRKNSNIIDAKLGIYLIFFSILVVYCHLLISVKANYLPVWSDEFFYYINAKSFYLNSTLKAALTFNGQGATLGGGDAHGLVYPLLHGSIAKLWGWNNINIIYTNFFLVLAAISIITTQNFLTRQQKILWVTAFLLFPFLSLYIITYMQEVIQVFFAVVASILIYKLYNTEKNTKYLIFFVAFLLLAGFFRPIWPFWLIGLIPLAKTRNQFFIYFLIFIVSSLAGFLINSLMCEKIPAYFNSVIDLITTINIKAAFTSLLTHFLSNIKLYLTFTAPGSIGMAILYFSQKFLILFLICFFGYKSIKTKNKLYSALTLIGGINFFMLLVFYDAQSWREIRSLAPLYYFYLLFLVLWLDSKKLRYSYLLLVFLLISFILGLSISKYYLEQRNALFARKNYEKSARSYDEIAKFVDKKPDALVLLSFHPIDNSIDLLTLPLRSDNDNPIRYIVRYYVVKLNQNDIDFILTHADDKNYPENEAIIKNENYVLYKNTPLIFANQAL
jgi:hypothetical protein